MGNETSQLKGLKIDDKALEVNDFYSLHLGEKPGELSPAPKGGKPPSKTAKLPPSQFYGIFKCDTAVQPNYVIDQQNALERAVRNMKIFRHPSILKYVASWKSGTTLYLATEQCRPALTMLPNMTDIEVCLGLKSILSALIFLVDQANTKHLNVAISSIYVNNEGVWKLFGFEHVFKQSEVIPTLLDQTKNYRYANAIDARQKQNDTIEQFAFATLADDVLRGRTGTAIDEFRDYCATHLKHTDEQLRPKLEAVLLHPYFNHNFIQIHSYLVELPLKTAESKQDFFSTLADCLRSFDETVVASQLSHLLISQLVLLDPTAKVCLIPHLLRPRTEETPLSLFGVDTFEKYLIPRLKTQFCIKDAQIRIALLEFFPSYVEMFDKENLKNEILPQLLLGMKDTNDFLVSRTLFCMADLVQIFGADAVIGTDRTKIFSDGRPNQKGPECVTKYNKQQPRSITPVMSVPEDLLSVSPTPTDDMISTNSVEDSIVVAPKVMLERLSPEGADNGEGELPIMSEGEGDEWSDWDTKDTETVNRTEHSQITTVPTKVPTLKTSPINLKLVETVSPRPKTITSTVVNDLDTLDTLDIKNQIIKVVETPAEFDFFKDMAPDIQTTTSSVSLIKHESDTQKSSSPPLSSSSNRLVAMTDTEDAIGWDDGDTWGE